MGSTKWKNLGCEGETWAYPMSELFTKTDPGTDFGNKRTCLMMIEKEKACARFLIW